MQYDEYILAIKSLEKTADEPQDKRIRHAILGLLTEAGELIDAYKKFEIYGKPMDVVNVLEELGDLLWYLSVAYDAMGMKFDDPTAEEIKEITDLISSEGGLTKEILVVVHGTFILRFTLKIVEAIDEGDITEIHGNIEAITANIACVAHAFGSDLPTIRKINIAKLKARYPDKFSSEAALNRDLATERKILERGGSEPVEKQKSGSKVSYLPQQFA